MRKTKSEERQKLEKQRVREDGRVRTRLVRKTQRSVALLERAGRSERKDKYRGSERESTLIPSLPPSLNSKHSLNYSLGSHSVEHP